MRLCPSSRVEGNPNALQASVGETPPLGTGHAPWSKGDVRFTRSSWLLDLFLGNLSLAATPAEKLLANHTHLQSTGFLNAINQRPARVTMPGFMDERTARRLVDQLAGDGWLLHGGVRLGQVTYAINIFEVRTSRQDRVLGGSELVVRLFNHSIDASLYTDAVLTLALRDGRSLTGFISEDGTQLVRTGMIT